MQRAVLLRGAAMGVARHGGAAWNCASTSVAARSHHALPSGTTRHHHHPFRPSGAASPTGGLCLPLPAAAAGRKRWLSAQPEHDEHPATVGNLLRHPLVLAFGSQTGTAQMICEDLHDHATTKGMTSHVVDMRDTPGQDLVDQCIRDGSVLIFVVANFGKGEPTDNARAMFEWFMSPDREHGNKFPLLGLRYAVFGLGRSDAYPENYQRVGRTLHERLEALGAAPIAKRGEGDASGDMDADAAQWEESLWTALDALPPSPAAAATTAGAAALAGGDAGACAAPGTEAAGAPAVATAARAPAPAAYLLPHFADLAEEDAHPGTAAEACNSSAPCWVRMLRNERITPPASPRTVHRITFDATSLPYRTGDYLGVLPQNAYPAAADAIAGLGLKPDAPAPGLPKAVPLAEAVRRRCDVGALPRRGLLRRLAPLATDDKERERLAAWGAPDDAGKAAYEANVVSQKMTFAQLLREHRSLKLCAAQLLELCPVIQPRFYSISSSSLASPTAIDLTVGVHDFRTPSGPRPGLCSHFLDERSAIGDEVGVFVQTSEFRLPSDATRPIILIAAGTGIAPFKGFLDERAKQKASGMAVAPATLYFGAAAPDTNDMYRAQFEAMGPDVVKVHMAYSDSAAHPSRFPQHLLAADARAVFDAVTYDRAAIYVCGHGLLGTGVRDALADAIVAHSPRAATAAAAGAADPRSVAAAIISEWSSDGRFHEDIFQ